MAVKRTDIERALDELVSNEEGMRFQGLAVVLGKHRWPELIACERKKDFGLDAYAPASLTEKKAGRGLASSITPTLKKISSDAKQAKEHFTDLSSLLFVTPAKVGNTDKLRWAEAIQKEHNLDLHVISREEIINELMKPENAPLCAGFLGLDVVAEPELADLVVRTKRAAAEVAAGWIAKTKGYPLIDLDAVRIDARGEESSEVFSMENIDGALARSERLVLEAPAGRGKTTMLVQLAQRARAGQIAFMVNLPAWTSRRTDILDYIAGMPPFRAQGISAGDLARIQTRVSLVFLLNGWNEIALADSPQADTALRELEYVFPAAGIVVATRTHHLTPLPGATRLRLLPLRRDQRAAYLAKRLRDRAQELQRLLDADLVLDGLTRTPFILSEVVSLFEAGIAIPDTKAGVLAAVTRLHEGGEHRNALQSAPLFGRHSEYLQALATEMTRRGAVSISETDAREVVAVVGRALIDRRQIGDAAQQPADIMASLTAHHLIERVEYPEPVFRFQHQLFQEYYAAICVRSRLLGLRDSDARGLHAFVAEYVNQPSWTEPLRIVAEMLGSATDGDSLRGGRLLVQMALGVDVVFAGELAQLGGDAIWSGVRETVGARLRELYSRRHDGFRQYALAAMLATGSSDFKDVILPLLSASDDQVRLTTYRLWPDMLPSSLGADWRKEVSGWSAEARADFVSELLHHRFDADVAAFAAADPSAKVKKAAVSGLSWTGSIEAAAPVLESMDTATFADIARRDADQVPAVLEPRVADCLRSITMQTADQPARLRAALDLINQGETDLDAVVKDALVTLGGSSRALRDLAPRYIRPALDHLRTTDPAWVGEWVALHVADDSLYPSEEWLVLATEVPGGLVERLLQRVENEDLGRVRFHGAIDLLTAVADEKLAARVFSRLRELRRRVDGDARANHELEWRIIRQLEDLFRGLPADVGAAAILASTSGNDPVDIKVVTDLLSRVARSHEKRQDLVSAELKAGLRSYLLASVDAVLHQDDFSGEQKATLASSIARVGKPEDMSVLVALIKADIARVRRGRAARAAGDRGPVGNGAVMCYAGWHVAAVVELDSDSAEKVLIDLLSEPEYRVEVASAMARDFLPQHEARFGRMLPYELIWAAREGRHSLPGEPGRRRRYSAALNATIASIQQGSNQGVSPTGLKELARALAAIDGVGSASAVLNVIALPGKYDESTRIDSAERLLLRGVALPKHIAFNIIDTLLERTGKWMDDSSKYVLRRGLCLCAFVDDQEAGIAKIREVISQKRLWAHELREIVTALGESRSKAASGLLLDLAKDAQTFEACESEFAGAFSVLDTSSARDVLVGFVDPDARIIAPTRGLQHVDAWVTRLADLARRDSETAARLYELCDRDLPASEREMLSQVLSSLGTAEAHTASLNLINDRDRAPVPRGIKDELEGAFVESRPYGDRPHVFTQHARAANELRTQLFRMVAVDEKRRRSAYQLLGEIEEWRLEYGRPAGEPRHPDLASGKPWPPTEPDL